MTPHPDQTSPMTVGPEAFLEDAVDRPPTPDDVDALIERLLDAQQDINFAANCSMDQSLCDASALIDDVEVFLNRVKTMMIMSAELLRVLKAIQKVGVLNPTNNAAVNGTVLDMNAALSKATA